MSRSSFRLHIFLRLSLQTGGRAFGAERLCLSRTPGYRMSTMYRVLMDRMRDAYTQMTPISRSVLCIRGGSLGQGSSVLAQQGLIYLSGSLYIAMLADTSVDRARLRMGAS